MSFIDPVSGEFQFKIVYCGCAQGGKTASLVCLHERAPARDRGRLVLLNHFFDFLPIDLGTVKGGSKVRFSLWTVPGPRNYNATRRLLLRGVDGIVFVVDSQWDRMEANLESLHDLEQNLAAMEISLQKVPWALFYNKRDLAEHQIAPVESIDLLFEASTRGVRRFAGSCISGTNVLNALNEITQTVVDRHHGR